MNDSLEIGAGIPPVRIGSRAIGPAEPPFVIAEAGVNHNGDLNLACRLVDAAAAAGADAVKFQTFIADRVVSPTAMKAAYQIETTDPGESHLEMLRRLELGRDDLTVIQARCAERGILFLSTPFDEDSVDLLDAIGVPAFKIASGEVTNLPFLQHVARKGRPVLLSTGMSYLGEVDAAVRTLQEAGCTELALLHCVTSYPARPDDVNLAAMRTMQEAFAVPVGFSDHTPGIEVAMAAIALGACVLEKHLTLDRSLPGPDHAASLEQTEFARLVAGTRAVAAALGDGRKQPAPCELTTRGVVRRSVAIAVDVPAGTVLRRELLRTLRPGTGLPPEALDSLVGRRTTRAFSAGELLTWSGLQ